MKKKEKEEETSPVRSRVGTLTGHIAPQTDERPLRGSSNEDPGGDAAVLALDRGRVPDHGPVKSLDPGPCSSKLDMHEWEEGEGPLLGPASLDSYLSASMDPEGMEAT